MQLFDDDLKEGHLNQDFDSRKVTLEILVRRVGKIEYEVLMSIPIIASTTHQLLKCIIA